MAAACARPPTDVDVWIRKDPADVYGFEPYTGYIHVSPDIYLFGLTSNEVDYATYDPAVRFANIVQVTVRNRGTQTARNVEVYLYWAEPATYIPTDEWRWWGIYTDPPGFENLGNLVVVPELEPGDATDVSFGWAAPGHGWGAPGTVIARAALLARLEHAADPSELGTAGYAASFAAIRASNNLALRNDVAVVRG